MTSSPCYRQERASVFVERRREIALVSCCVVLLVTGLAGAAREIRIIVDDEVMAVAATPAFRVGDVLKQAGVELRDGDKVTPQVSEGTWERCHHCHPCSSCRAYSRWIKSWASFNRPHG